ncbi:MAG: nucleotidyltransferase domain-containing protein [Candidatus Bathyarchaeia archaeon]
MRELEEYTEKAVKKGAIAVILVGSLARGDYTAFSDADIIIVIGESREKPVERLTKYMEAKVSIDIEPRVYTIKELREMIKNNAGIVREIAEYGILLGGDENIINEIKRRGSFNK